MHIAIVIPARYASSRLPGKPLLRSTGKYLVQHVYERALKARCAAEVIVATDDTRILAAVESFGGRAVMTRKDHPSGTDRIAEVVAYLNTDAVINLQGDEPLIEPASLDLLAGVLEADRGANMATLAAPICDRAAYENPNVVKVVCDDRGRALYFSRRAIPMVRGGFPDFAARPPRFLHHVGVYAYRRDFLLRTASTQPHPLEEAEQLEQLRVLATGGTIAVGFIPRTHRGVDTPADYDDFVREYRQTITQRRAA